MEKQLRTVEFAPGKELSVDLGRLAKQAHGSAVIQFGETMVLNTAVSNYDVREGQPFFPLTVDYRENFAAGGRFPGGFIKREGRPNEKEILTSRLIDRVIRPMFPKGYMNETQVLAYVMSSDGENDADVISAVGASIALTISDIPFAEPIAEVRVGRVDGEFVINPTFEEQAVSDIELVIGGTAKSVVMVEGEMQEISEEEMLEAIKAGHEAIIKLCDFQEELRKEFGNEKREFIPEETDEELNTKVRGLIGDKMDVISRAGYDKAQYSTALDELKEEVLAKFEEELDEEAYAEVKGGVKGIIGDVQKESLRNMILNDGVRLDGRSTTQIRPIWTEVGYIPRTHGSSIFTRGETQALVYATLGTARDAQGVDTLFDTEDKKFMLDYNFPPFCVGEAKFLRGASRREIGHGNLAERSLRMMMPSHDDFSYTVRVVSDILESNGSSSMASICGGSMALMDAGVPLKKPVSGIAMGMIVGEDGNVAVLSDIQGEEDFMGDMDFKLAGTADGITGCQMDIKVQGIPYEVMEEAMHQARDGRLFILTKMAESISVARSQISQHAPQLTSLEIELDEIGAIIGPGGKVIKAIQSETGTEINIEEGQNKGKVTIAAKNGEDAEAAKKMIKGILGDLEEGAVYEGKVQSIKDYGAFVEIVPGKDGLLHISEVAHERIENIRDVLSEGDIIKVKLLKVEGQGRLKLSRKAILPKEGEEENEEG
jgi:polyribonucleotide nucleotidyltransferase